MTAKGLVIKENPLLSLTLKTWYQNERKEIQHNRVWLLNNL